jgi:hypothetical protein
MRPGYILPGRLTQSRFVNGLQRIFGVHLNSSRNRAKGWTR